MRGSSSGRGRRSGHASFALVRQIGVTALVLNAADAFVEKVVVLGTAEEIARASSTGSLHLPFGTEVPRRLRLLVKHFEGTLRVPQFQNLDNEMVIFFLDFPLLVEVIFVGFRPQVRKILALGLLLVDLALDIEEVSKVAFVVVMISEQLREVMGVGPMSVSYIHACTYS